MRIEYEIAEQDFVNAQHLAVRNSPNFFVRLNRLGLPLFGLALFLFWVYTVVQQGFSLRLIPGLIFCLFFMAIPLLSQRAWKNSYAKSTAMHGRLSIIVEEEGLHFQGATFSSQVGWSNFSRFFEDQKSFVLYQNQQVINIIAKRTLTPEEIQELRRYFEKNIGQAAK